MNFVLYHQNWSLSSCVVQPNFVLYGTKFVFRVNWPWVMSTNVASPLHKYRSMHKKELEQVKKCDFSLNFGVPWPTCHTQFCSAIQQDNWKNAVAARFGRILVILGRLIFSECVFLILQMQGPMLWFLKYFAEKNCEKLAVFYSKQS
jgi:hypothetical protein